MILSTDTTFVFVSYARKDLSFVKRLQVDLDKHGITIWIDQEAIQPGTSDWEESIREAIRSSTAILLIASPNARSSRYVRDELRIASMYQRPVYPFWIAGSEWMEAIPLGWGGVQYLDARNDHYMQALSDLLLALSKQNSSRQLPVLTHGDPVSLPNEPRKTRLDKKAASQGQRANRPLCQAPQKSAPGSSTLPITSRMMLDRNPTMMDKHEVA